MKRSKEEVQEMLIEGVRANIGNATSWDEIKPIIDDVIDECDLEISRYDFDEEYLTDCSEFQQLCLIEEAPKKVQVRDEVITAMFSLIVYTTDEVDFREFMDNNGLSKEACDYVAKLYY